MKILAELPDVGVDVSSTAIALGLSLGATVLVIVGVTAAFIVVRKYFWWIVILNWFRGK